MGTKYCYVDVAMMGSVWNPEEDSLEKFCEILQEVVGASIEIIPVSDSYNGAPNSDHVDDALWNKALDIYIKG